MQDNTKLINLAQASEMTGLSRKQINNLINSGRLGFIMVGSRKYIPAIELDDFISKSTIHLVPQKSVHNDVDLAQMRKSRESQNRFNSSQYFEQIRKAHNGLSI